MSSEKKLLIILHGALGDVVLTFPTILFLRGAYNRIDAVCQKKIGDLAHRMGLIDGRIDINAFFLATIYSDEPINAPTEQLLQQYDRVILFSFSRSLEDALKQITGDRMNRIPPRPAVHEKIHVGKYIADLLAANKILETTAVPRDLIEKWRREHRSWFKSADPQKIIIHPGSRSLKKTGRLNIFYRPSTS